MSRKFLAVAFLLVAARPAAAQITTYIAPPRQAEEAALIAIADSARRDSVERETLASMTAWVDSAAGVAIPPSVGANTPDDPGRPVTTFVDGSVAPATASSLPTLLLLGAVAFGAGLVLLARPKG